MSVRKRAWDTTKGERQEAWVVNFSDDNLKRRQKTFATKKEAERFHKRVRAAASVTTSSNTLIAALEHVRLIIDDLIQRIQQIEEDKKITRTWQ